MGVHRGDLMTEPDDSPNPTHPSPAAPTAQAISPTRRADDPTQLNTTRTTAHHGTDLSNPTTQLAPGHPTTHNHTPQPGPTTPGTSSPPRSTTHPEPGHPTTHAHTPQPRATNRKGTAATIIVLVVAFLGVALVWALSAWSSFSEQTRLSSHESFTHPSLLPWTLDGLAFALALIALAAALDGRPAVAARAGVVIVIAASVWANTRGVAVRAVEDAVTSDAFKLAAIAPISAVIAFETILAAIRRAVFRWRGQPPPVAIPTLRPVRVFLAPWSSFWTWRREVLTVTGGVPARRRDRRQPEPIDPADYFAGLEPFAEQTPPEAWDRPPEPPEPSEPDTERLTGPPLAPPGPVEPAKGATARSTVDRAEPVDAEPGEPADSTGGRKVTPPDVIDRAYRVYERTLLEDNLRMTASQLAPILDVTEDRARTIRRTKLDPRFKTEHPGEHLRLVG